MKRLLVLAALLFVLPAHAEVTIEWVTVGAPGNAADDTGYGAVAYSYKISKYEITNAQYAEFLNAVAATDTYALYNANMGSESHSGIARTGSPGSFTYSVKAGMGNKPVDYVSFYDSIRFANWLHNGQPAGAQDWTTTEDGAYYMPLGSSVVRKHGARVLLPNEDEWYKAAYYDPLSKSYFDYPVGTDVMTTCVFPSAAVNTANCFGYDGTGVPRTVTDVGAYSGSVSPNRTFDQGGNVWEWNEAIIGSSRGLRGASFNNGPSSLAASYRNDLLARGEHDDKGFRVASSTPRVPSLSPIGVALLGVLVLAIAVGGLAAQRRRGAG